MSKKAETKELALVEDFNALAIFRDGDISLAEILQENVGAELSAFDLPKLTVPTSGGDHWSVQTAQGSKMEKEIEGIIVHVQYAKTYWAVNLDDANEITPPNCSSEDGLTGVGEPGGNCQTCPLNEFGSRGKGKACRDRADVFVLMKTGIVPTRIQVPGTSLASLKQYGIILLDSGKRISDVVTKFTLNPEMKSGKKTAIIKFQSGGEVSPEMKALGRQYKATIMEMMVRQPSEGVVESTAHIETVAEDGKVPFD